MLGYKHFAKRLYQLATGYRLPEKMRYPRLKTQICCKIRVFTLVVSFTFLVNTLVVAAPQIPQKHIIKDGQIVNPEVDFQLPNTFLLPAPSVQDDGEFTNSNSQLHVICFTISIPGGGIIKKFISRLQSIKIAEYKYSIGTSAGTTDIRNWTSAGRNKSITATGLDLQNGQAYYFNVKAKDIRGRWSRTGSSDGIIVDITPPSFEITSPEEGEWIGIN